MTLLLHSSTFYQIIIDPYIHLKFPIFLYSKTINQNTPHPVRYGHTLLCLLSFYNFSVLGSSLTSFLTQFVYILHDILVARGML